MYVVNGSDGRCIVAVRLIVGVRYLERPLREVLLYMYILLVGLSWDILGHLGHNGICWTWDCMDSLQLTGMF